jgi:hypothetical protein
VPRIKKRYFMGSRHAGAPDSQSCDFNLLDRELHSASAITAPLFRKVTENTGCTRLLSLLQSEKALSLDRMIEAGAWTDAAITLIGFELPNWSVRRLVCEDGEWLCSLSRQPNLPMFLDEPAEGSHAVLPLAILRAFIAARCMGAGTRQAAVSVPRVRPLPAYVFCCDNLA